MNNHKTQTLLFLFLFFCFVDTAMSSEKHSDKKVTFQKTLNIEDILTQVEILKENGLRGENILVVFSIKDTVFTDLHITATEYEQQSSVIKVNPHTVLMHSHKTNHIFSLEKTRLCQTDTLVILQKIKQTSCSILAISDEYPHRKHLTLERIKRHSIGFSSDRAFEFNEIFFSRSFQILGNRYETQEEAKHLQHWLKCNDFYFDKSLLSSQRTKALSIEYPPCRYPQKDRQRGKKQKLFFLSANAYEKSDDPDFYFHFAPHPNKTATSSCVSPVGITDNVLFTAKQNESFVLHELLKQNSQGSKISHIIFVASDQSIVQDFISKFSASQFKIYAYHYSLIEQKETERTTSIRCFSL